MYFFVVAAANKAYEAAASAQANAVGHGHHGSYSTVHKTVSHVSTGTGY